MIRGNNAAGSVSIRRPLVEKVVFSLHGLPFCFQRAKMAKVELSLSGSTLTPAMLSPDRQRR